MSVALVFAVYVFVGVGGCFAVVTLVVLGGVYSAQHAEVHTVLHLSRKTHMTSFTDACTKRIPSVFVTAVTAVLPHWLGFNY